MLCMLYWITDRRKWTFVILELLLRQKNIFYGWFCRPPFPTCCQTNGHCGWDCDDVPPPAPVATAPSRPLVLPSSDNVRTPVIVSGGSAGVRDDGRCGVEFDGAGCDPNSEYFCCSAHGYCGGTGEHCSCDTCIDYRPAGGITITTIHLLIVVPHWSMFYETRTPF